MSTDDAKINLWKRFWQKEKCRKASRIFDICQAFEVSLHKKKKIVSL